MARGVYGEKLIEKLSKDMTEKSGRGFSPTNLKMMRLFYQTFPIRQTLSDESTKIQKSETGFRESQKRQTLSVKFEPMLSWSHYCELLKVEEPIACFFYEKEAIQNNWSVRELKRQINAMLFERLTYSKNARAFELLHFHIDFIR